MVVLSANLCRSTCPISGAGFRRGASRLRRCGAACFKLRTDVVGTFPNPAALLRRAGHALIEQHDCEDKNALFLAAVRPATRLALCPAFDPSPAARNSDTVVADTGGRVPIGAFAQAPSQS